MLSRQSCPILCDPMAGSSVHGILQARKDCHCLGNKPKLFRSCLKLHPSITFWTLVDSEGYSISFKGFLPTAVDITVI